jgi:glutaredoxin
VSFVRFLVVLLLLVAGCRREIPNAVIVPPPDVTDSSQGLRFTYLDEKGDFHTVDTVAEVPPGSRDVVRVADPNKEDPPDQIFLADLRNLGPNGKYVVRSTTRDELDKIAEQRRAKHGTVLADQPPGAPSAADTGPDVIIYGASWCGPCHQAAAYLKSRGVRFVEKDIEKDRGAAREMQAKLTKAGKAGGSIPVLDVKGRVLVGFDPGSVDRALGAR